MHDERLKCHSLASTDGSILSTKHKGLNAHVASLEGQPLDKKEGLVSCLYASYFSAYATLAVTWVGVCKTAPVPDLAVTWLVRACGRDSPQ